MSAQGSRRQMPLFGAEAWTAKPAAPKPPSKKRARARSLATLPRCPKTPRALLATLGATKKALASCRATNADLLKQRQTALTDFAPQRPHNENDLDLDEWTRAEKGVVPRRAGRHLTDLSLLPTVETTDAEDNEEAAAYNAGERHLPTIAYFADGRTRIVTHAAAVNLARALRHGAIWANWTHDRESTGRPPGRPKKASK
jgi:hypothetical protein